MSHARIRGLLVIVWLAVASGALYLFFFHREPLQREFETAAMVSIVAGTLIYLFFGCLRGFTLIPSTTLLMVAIPFFPPTWLFILTLIGILVSSASIYLFSEALHLDELLARKHERQVKQLKAVLQRYQLPVIIGWSFFPFAPTDLVCYVCGVLEVDFRTCLLGVGLGEGAICAIYIFLGDYTLRILHLRW
jgi:uncharacterized membrane protein YdjX (TVP38/TMEM64 family)